MNPDLEHIEQLRTQAREFPKLPGVYLMKDGQGEVIYIGKAKDLRARVRTYFAGGDGRAQLGFLLKRVRTIDKILTQSDEQAYLLERDLINKFKPRYNIRLKDDKAYLSIRVDRNAQWPRLELTRKIVDDGALYFGPYTSSYELRTVLEIIKRVVPLRTCTNTVFYNRQRPCLEYQIKRCAGPCCLPVDSEQYTAWVKQAITILEGKTTKVEQELTAQMEQSAAELRFEDSAIYRDRLELLKSFRSGSRLFSPTGDDKDVFAVYREEGLAALSVLRMRNGRVADTANFDFSEVCVPTAEIIESALLQYYEGGKDIPPEIFVQELPLDNEFVCRHLSQLRGLKVDLTQPKRGLNMRLLDLAELNAKEHYRSKFDSETRYIELAKTLSKKARLRQIPRRIECVDISNFQGSDIVGALVTFVDGRADKSLYRKYKISFDGKPDDFQAMYEVVFRRLNRAKEENDLPDLLIVDGGALQLGKALAARDALGLSLDIISLAKVKAFGQESGRNEKKPERIFLEGQEDPVPMPSDSELTHFLAKVRDEVHRFVITFHRNKRAKRVFKSALDGIAGVGPERRGRILRAFGDVSKIVEAAPAELAKAGRMPLALAEKIITVLKRG